MSGGEIVPHGGAAVIPIRQGQPAGELEAMVIGAVLELEDKFELMDSMGLGRDDFVTPRASIVWFIARRLAERRMEVSAVTVCSAGKRAGLLAEADLRWLTDLQEANLLSREQAIQVAEDLRVQARGRQILAQLRQAQETIERGRWSPARLALELETIARNLDQDFAADESAEGVLDTLNERWANNIDQGKLTVDPTGIRVLDSIIGGTPQNLTIVQGLRGAGKDVLLTTMIRAQLELDLDKPEPERSKTGLFWLEDGTEALLRRWQAEDLGILMREVGAKVLTPEQIDRKNQIDRHHRALLKRVVHFKHDSITRAELRRRCMRMIYRDKVTRIVINNMKEIDHSDPRQKLEHWQRVAETTRVIRNLARDAGVPVVLAIHDTDETPQEGKEHAPDPGKMMGGQTAGDRARLVLGVWRKGQAIRVTVTKGNEISDAGVRGPTVELQRNFEAGTANPQGGRIIDLKAEQAQARRDQRDQKIEDSAEDTIQRKSVLARKLKQLEAQNPPTEPPPPPPQAALDLGNVASSKPEGA